MSARDNGKATRFAQLRRGSVIRALGASLAFAAMLPGGDAHADEAASSPPPADAVAQARSHFTRGVKLYEEDDFRAALIEFNRAYELAPNWAVLYNVGQSYYQLRDYGNALRTLSKYVEQGGAQIPVDRRSQVDREIEELRGRSAHVTILSNTEGATVTLDDVPLGDTPFSAPELVGEGRHTFRLTKPGFATATQVVDIAGGDTLKVTLELAPPLGVAPLPAPSVERAPSHLPAIVSLGVGGAGLALGTVFGILAVNDKSTLKSACRGTACPTSAQADINAFSRDGAVSTVGFVVGGAGVAAAVILYFTERPHAVEAPAARARGTTIHPWFVGTSGGVGGMF